VAIPSLRMRPIVMLSDLLISTFTASLATSRLSQQANGMETDGSSCRVFKSCLMPLTDIREKCILSYGIILLYYIIILLISHFRTVISFKKQNFLRGINSRCDTEGISCLLLNPNLLCCAHKGPPSNKPKVIFLKKLVF
jgi:hypothetical protein